MLFLWVGVGEASSQIEKLNQKIPYASKGETKEILHTLENIYISSVVAGDKAKEAKVLRSIIRCQRLLHIDTSRYQKELYKLGISGNQSSTQPKKQIAHKASTHSTSKKSKIRMIRSISEKEGNLIIKFDRPLVDKDLFFFKIKNKDGYKNIYDVQANLNFKTPKLHFTNLRQIKIAQNRQGKVRIVLVDEAPIYSKAYLREGSLFIKIHANATKTKKPLSHLFPKSQTSTSRKPKTIVVPKVKKSSHSKKPAIKIESKPTKKSSQNIYASSKTIVIDAGHGGHDSGAVGYKKYQEKKAVFKVAKLLRSLLEKKGYQVYMTRDKDSFVKLKNRTHYANKKEADLFISIHANAAPKGKYLSLKGIETFFLSPAKTAKAKRIAAKENAAASDLDKKSQNTLLSFLNRNKIIQSNKLAIDVQSATLKSTRKGFKGVKDGGVREAPFWVLVGAQMPAVLVELGYITNPTEGERLFNPFYQKALAKGIYNGINNYFAKNK